MTDLALMFCGRKHSPPSARGHLLIIFGDMKSDWAPGNKQKLPLAAKAWHKNAAHFIYAPPGSAFIDPFLCSDMTLKCRISLM